MAKRKQGEIDEQYRSDLSFVMSSDQGRRFVDRLLASFGMDEPTYKFDGDAIGMALREGRRTCGVEVERELRLFADREYQILIRERLSREALEREDDGIKDDEYDGITG
jgi:hypothetical protein